MQVTGISNSEEEAMGRADLVPFLLEDRIREVRMQSLSTYSSTLSCIVSAGWGQPIYLRTLRPATLHMQIPACNRCLDTVYAAAAVEAALQVA